MNLVWFLTIGTVLSVILGELGRYPFGSPGAVGITDLILSASLDFLLIWQLGIKRKVVPFPGWKLALGFILTGVISLLLSKDLSGAAYLVRFTVYSLVLWLSFSLCLSKTSSFEGIKKLLILVSVILAFHGFLQLLIFPNLTFLTDFGFDPHQFRLTSTFLDPNFMGALLNIGLLLSLDSLRLKRSKLNLFSLAVLSVAVVLTFSRSAYLMLAVSLLLYGLFKMKKLVVVLLVAALALYLFFPSFTKRVNGGLSIDQSASQRFISWGNGLEAFRDSPIFGVGFDNLRDYFARKDLFAVFSSNGGHSGEGVDSSLIFLLATTGVVGLAFYLAWFIYMIELSLKHPQGKVILCIMVGLLIDSQFINSLFYPPIMLFVNLLLGASL